MIRSQLGVIDRLRPFQFLFKIVLPLQRAMLLPFLLKEGQITTPDIPGGINPLLYTLGEKHSILIGH